MHRIEMGWGAILHIYMSYMPYAICTYGLQHTEMVDDRRL